MRMTRKKQPVHKLYKWEQWWNKHNLHKVQGIMVAKPHPSPSYDPRTTNHERHLYRRALRGQRQEQARLAREFEKQQANAQ